MFKMAYPSNIFCNFSIYDDTQDSITCLETTDTTRLYQRTRCNLKV
jgi:hypothetical protein